MAMVSIPSLMRSLTGGQGQLQVRGRTVGEVVIALDEQYPGIKARLCQGEQLNPALAVFIDGQMSDRGLLAAVNEQSEIHFLPAIGGG